MTVQAYIIMTQTERDAGEALNDVDAGLGARQINNSMADNLGRGSMQGLWVSPARLLNDVAYMRWVLTLGLLPIAVLDSETLFLPDPEI